MSVFTVVAKKLADGKKARETIKAYHGSPHDFDKFSTEELGSGTGVFGQGKGMYFAENEATARSYRDSLAQMSENNKGHMYKVDINATLDEMLAYEKPLSQQEPAVLEKIKQNLPKIRKTLKLKDDVLDQQLLDNYTGDYLFQRLNTETGGDAVNFLEGIGFKGFRYPDPQTRFSKNPTDNYVVWKDALVNITKKYGLTLPVATAVMSGALTPQEAQAGFFSQAVKAAQALQRKSGNVQSFWNDLTGKGQVKPDELNAMGFKEHFGNRNDISKEEVQQFINDNQISIDEVLLGAEQKYFVKLDSDGSYVVYDGTNDNVYSAHATLEIAIEKARDLNESLGGARFGRYTLDDGESGDNYRELLLRLPIDPKTKREIMALQEEALEVNAKQKPLYDELQALLKKEMDNNGNFANPDAEKKVLEIESERDRIAKKESQLYSQIHEKMNASGYKSGHFDEDDILTHLRMKDRVDVDGNKTLMVEEVQSDWHQSGKEFGYRNDARIQEIADSLEAIDKRKKEIDSLLLPVRKMESDLSSKEIDDLISEYNDLGEKKLALEEEDFALSKTIPNAPFKGDDKSSWYNLAMKRALMEAAEGDYDKLAFTTGVEQADRYNLRNFVSSLKYQEDIVDGRPVNVLTAHDRDGHRVLSKGIKDPQTELPSIIGKEAAEKLLNADPYTPPQETRKIRTLRDQDLELGGEGMKQFYDRTLPNTLNKLVKQDGVKVGQTELPSKRMRSLLSEAELNELRDLEKLRNPSAYNEGLTNRQLERSEQLKEKLEMRVPDTDTVHSIDITPEMRERVKKGLSLFSTAVGVPTVGALFSPEGQAATVSDMAQQYGQLDQRQQQAEANKMALIKAESDRRRNMTRRQRRDNPPSEALRSHTMNQALKAPLAVGLGAIRGSAESLDYLFNPPKSQERIEMEKRLGIYVDPQDGHWLFRPPNIPQLVSPLTDIQVLDDKEADEAAKRFGSLFTPI